MISLETVRISSFVDSFKLNEVNKIMLWQLLIFLCSFQACVSSCLILIDYHCTLYLLEKIFYVEIKSILIQFLPSPGSCDQSSSVDILFRKNNTFSSATENMIFSASAKIKLKPTWNISLFTLIKY